MDEPQNESGTPRRRPPLEEERDRRYERLEAALRVHRIALALCAIFILVLITVMVAGKRQRIGRAILVDGKLACLVESKAMADKVREYLLTSAQGPAAGRGGATFRQQWSENDRAVGDERVLNLPDAAARLQPLLTVVVSATAIVVDGRQAVVVPDQDTANKALEALKARFFTAGEKLVQQQITSKVTFANTQVSPESVYSDISAAVTRLLKGSVATYPYAVKPGDSLKRIASLYSTTATELLEDNPALRSGVPRRGTQVTIKVRVPPVRIVTIKEVQEDKSYSLPPVRVPTAGVARGEKRELSPGAPGIKRVRSKQTWQNAKLVRTVVLDGQVIRPAVAAQVAVAP